MKLERIKDHFTLVTAVRYIRRKEEKMYEEQVYSNI